MDIIVSDFGHLKYIHEYIRKNYKSRTKILQWYATKNMSKILSKGNRRARE